MKGNNSKNLQASTKGQIFIYLLVLGRTDYLSQIKGTFN